MSAVAALTVGRIDSTGEEAGIIGASVDRPVAEHAVAFDGKRACEERRQRQKSGLTRDELPIDSELKFCRSDCVPPAERRVPFERRGKVDPNDLLYQRAEDEERGPNAGAAQFRATLSSGRARRGRRAVDFPTEPIVLDHIGDKRAPPAAGRKRPEVVVLLRFGRPIERVTRSNFFKDFKHFCSLLFF